MLCNIFLNEVLDEWVEPAKNADERRLTIQDGLTDFLCILWLKIKFRLRDTMKIIKNLVFIPK